MANPHLEEQKTRLEIKKLQSETGWFKKTVESLSTLSSLTTAIVAVGTLWYAYDKELIQNLVTKLKNDNSALQVTVDKLNSDIKILSKEKALINSEIQKSKNELIVLREKSRMDKIRFTFEMANREKLLKSINEKLTFTEDCYADAKEFISRFCVYYQPHDDHDYHPYLLIFEKSDEEIASLDYSQMDFIEFLLKYGNFKKERRGYQYFLVSNKIREINIGPYKRTDSYDATIYYKKFNCWKNLPKEQKIKLLKQARIREM